MPVKSSLSKYRAKISSLFFKDILEGLLSSFKRPTWRGYYIYGTDGFEMTLPSGGDLRAIGYKGSRVKTGSGATGETYYPHMFTVQTYDVLSRTTKAVYISTVNHETNGALENIKKLESKSITLYDRGFCNSKVIKAHFENRSHFFIRFKRGKINPTRDQAILVIRQKAG